MGFFEIFLIALSLSMDAFAVSLCKGLSTSKISIKHYIITGLYFGGFQALMPTIGYFLGSYFEHLITSVDHWIAFGLLAFIGINMLREAGDGAEESDNGFDVATMLPAAIATSIDALAVGITFGILKDINICSSALTIGITTFILSAIGLKAGNIFGLKYKAKAEIAGGIVLIGLGLKILLQHLGILAL